MKLKLLLFFFFTFSIVFALKKESKAADENIAENGYVSIKK